VSSVSSSSENRRDLLTSSSRGMRASLSSEYAVHFPAAGRSGYLVQNPALWMTWEFAAVQMLPRHPSTMAGLRRQAANEAVATALPRGITRDR
jgi:hypothetical protein